MVGDLAEMVPAKKEVSFARLAIDSALEGLGAGSFKYPVEAFKAGSRALELARMVNDADRAIPWNGPSSPTRRHTESTGKKRPGDTPWSW
jgi:hypothetical protein